MNRVERWIDAPERVSAGRSTWTILGVPRRLRRRWCGRHLLQTGLRLRKVPRVANGIGHASARDVPIDDADQLMAHDDVSGVESSFDVEKMLCQLPPKMSRAISYVKLEGLASARPPRNRACRRQPSKCPSILDSRHWRDWSRRRSNGEDRAANQHPQHERRAGRPSRRAPQSSRCS